MNKSKQWLLGANQLCAEIGLEDGIDPRYLARSFDQKSKNYKSKQLCKSVQHSLSLLLMGEFSDPMLQNLDVISVNTNNDGQFLLVTVALVDLDLVKDEEKVLNKLHAIQGFLRSEIAYSIKRKRVPALKFDVVRKENKEVTYANSKNDE